MKLISLEVEGYRRFATKQRLQLDCRNIALLGPNEAGKSSLLRLLETLNDAKPFRTSGPSQDTSRHKGPYDNEHALVEVRFLIEQSDVDLLQDVVFSKQPRWLSVKKLVGGRLVRTIDRGDVEFVLSSKAALIDKISERLTSRADSEEAGSLSMFEDFLAEIRVDAETSETNEFSRDTLLKIREVEKLSLSGMDAEIVTEIKKRIELEKHSGWSYIERTIFSMIPKFVFFSQEDRDLKSSYDLMSFFGETKGKEKKEKVPRGLQNIADAASLQLEELFNVSRSADRGAVATKIADANKAIQGQLSSWTQSQIEFQFSLNGTELSILVRNKSGGFESISERSDGLRQFIALSCFLARDGTREPNVVLLIDEAETHLHCDAQADFIQMLARQGVAKKVIYTTHSLACLPEDLGAGIRFVQPTDNDIRGSEINNKFWLLGGVGLSPVLAAMGAATMAFLPVRFCVLTEGASDYLLLPSLLREARGLDSLGFQVSPGLSQAGKAGLSLMMNEGARVAFFIDGDEGGKNLEAKISGLSIDARKIVRLDGILGGDSVLEDLVDKPVIVWALNEEFRRRGIEHRISLADLPDLMRWDAVKAWCLAKSVPEPSKVTVAYRILDYKADGNSIAMDRAEALNAIYSRLVSSWNVQ